MRRTLERRIRAWRAVNGWHRTPSREDVATKRDISAPRVKQSPFDGFFGAMSDILTPKWLPTSDPEIEKDALLVASYGKQLGRIGEALIVLLRDLPEEKLSDRDKQAIRDLKSMLNEIANVKVKHGARLVLRA